VQTASVNDKRSLAALQRKYRDRWDAHQLIAHRNTVLVRTGRQPSDEQLMEEQRAAAAVSLLRDEVLAMQE
jgi:hypothetical protein